MKQVIGLVCLVAVLAGVAYWILRDRPEAEAPYADALLEGKQKAGIQRVQGDMRAIHQALSSYVAGEGEYPEGNLGRALGPYMARVPLQDPWGGTIRYERTSPEEYTLRCAGPDGKFDTSDDIVSDTGVLSAP